MSELIITTKAFKTTIKLTIPKEEFQKVYLDSFQNINKWLNVSERKTLKYSLINNWTSLILNDKSSELANLFLNILNNKSPKESKDILEYFFIYLDDYKTNREILNFFDRLALRYIEITR